MSNLYWEGGDGNFDGPWNVDNTSNPPTYAMPGPGDYLHVGNRANLIFSGDGNVTVSKFVTNGDLSVANGSLDIAYGATLGVDLTQTGGTLTLGSSSSLGGQFVQAGGILSATGGIVTMNGGGSLGGTLSIGTVGTIDFAGGTFSTSGEVISGSGVLELTGGADLHVNSSETIGAFFQQENGLIEGTGTLTLAGGQEFAANGYTNDDESGTGTTLLKGTSIVEHYAAIRLDNGRILENAGTLFLDGGGIALGASGGNGVATVKNDAGAFIGIGPEGAINVTGGGGGTERFINNGTIGDTQSLTITTYIDVSFTNSSTGTINIYDGVLNLAGGGSLAGTWFATQNAYHTTKGTIELSGGTFLDSGSSGTHSGYGQGVVLLTNSGILDVETTGTIGTFVEQINGTIDGAGTLTLANGAEFGANGFTNDDELGNGTKGTTLLKGTSVLDQYAAVRLDQGRVFDIDSTGTLDWRGGGFSLGFQGGSTSGTITNAGLIEINAATSGVAVGGTGVDRFINSGQIIGYGTGATNIQASFTNTSTGFIEIHRGDLQLSGGGSLAGTWFGATATGPTAVGTIELSGGTFAASSSGVSGLGSGIVLLDSAGVLSVASSDYIGSHFQQSTGTIAGAGTLTLGNGGTFAALGYTNDDEVGTGTTKLLRTSQLNQYAALRLDGGRVLENSGTFNWTDGGFVLGFQGGTTGGSVKNDSGAIINITGTDGGGMTATGGVDNLINLGVIEKTAGATVTDIQAVLTNGSGTVKGTISAQAGILRFDGGGTSIGVLQASGGGVLDFNGGFFAISGTSAAGSTLGTIEITGTADIGATANQTVSLGTHVEQSGGTLDGAGLVIFAGGADFGSLGGYINDDELGTGTTKLVGKSQLDQYAAIRLDGGRVLENTGTFAWTDGSFVLGFEGGSSAGSVKNDSGAIINITGTDGGGMSVGGTGTNSLVNLGMFEKTAGATTTVISAVLSNGSSGTAVGTISAQSGILEFNGGGTSTGLLQASSGGVVDFAGGVFTVSGTSASGASAGTIEVTGTGDFTVNGTASLGTHVEQSGGTLDGTGLLILAGGADFGEITGTGYVNDDELGTGTTKLVGQSQLDQYSALRLDGGRVLENTGTFTWDASGIVMGFQGGTTGSTIQNDSGAVFNITGTDGGGISVGGTGTNSLINLGLFEKTAGSTTTNISAVLMNGSSGSAVGTISAQSGILEFSGGGTSTGVLQASHGGVLDFNGGTFTISGTSAAGSTTGAIAVSGTADFVVNGTASLGTRFFESGGTLDGTGVLILAGGAEFSNANQENNYELGSGTTRLMGQSKLDSGTQLLLDGGRTLENAGTFNWAGGNFLLGFQGGTAGATLRNDAGAVFNITKTDGGVISVQGTGADTFVNAGTFEETAGATANTIGVKFTDTGTITVTSGVLDFTAAGDSFAGTINGSTSVSIDGVSTFGALTIGGTVTVTNDTTIDQTGQVTIGDATTGGADFVNSSTGTFNIDNNSGIGVGTAAGSLFTNTGLLAKTGGTGTSVIAVNVTDTGSISVATGGILDFTGGTDSFTGSIAGAGTIEIGGGWSTFQSGTDISGIKGVLVGGGTLTLATDQSFGGTFTETGGTVALGTHTLTLSGTDSIGGAITGTGTLAISGGSTSLNAGASLAVSNLSLTGASTKLNVNASTGYAGALVASGGTITVGTGAAFTLSGTDTIASTIGGTGTLAISGGTTTLNAGTHLSTLSNLVVSGGTLAVGTPLSFAGTLSETNTGVLALGANTFTLTGTNSVISRSVTGTGTLAIGGGSLALTTGASLAVTHVSIASAAVSVGTNLTYAGALTESSGTLSLGTGDTLTLSGTGTNKLNGTISGAGTLSLTAGKDVLGTGASLSAGGLKLSGASTTLEVASSLGYAGSLVASGGTVTIDSGAAFTLSGTGTIASTIGGTGTLAIGAGTTTLNAGTHLTTLGNLALKAGTLKIGTPLSLGGAFSETAGSTLSIASGDAFTLAASSTLAGTVTGPGTLGLNGTTGVSGLMLNGALAASNSGTVNATGQLTIGDAASSASFLNAGTFNLASTMDTGIGAGIFGGSFLTNTGTLAKTAGTGTSVVQVRVTDTGTIKVASGILSFNGTNDSFKGTISGAGTIAFDGGGTSTIQSGTTLSGIGGIKVAGSGTTLTLGESLAYAGAFSETGGTVALGANTLTLSGASGIAGAVTGTGTLAVTGGTTTLNAGAALGESSLKLSGGTLAVASSLGYAGTFAGSGGTLSVATGATFTLSGTDTFASTFAGAGTLAVGGGTTTLNSGTHLGTLATLAVNAGTLALGTSLTYTGVFTEAAAGTVGIASGTTFTLGTAALGGTVGGPGTLALGGPTTVGALLLNGGLAVTNSGTADLTALVTIGDASTSAKLTNASSGTVNLDNNTAGIGVGSTAGSLLSNAGTLAKTGGTGTSTVAVNLTDTGVISVVSGVLDFTGASDSFAGTITGAGTVEFGGGSDTLAAGTTLSGLAGILVAGTDTLTLGGGLTYAGSFTETGGTVALGANTLTLSGTDTLAGTISGTGTLAIGGGATSLNAGANLTVSNLSLSGTSTKLSVASNLTYAGTAIANGGTISLVTGNTLTLSGTDTLASTVSGGGTLAVGGGTTTLNLGTHLTGLSGLKVTGGTLALGTSVSFAGTLTGAGGTVSIGSGDTFTLSGTNSVASSVTGAGTLAISSGTTTLKSGAHLTGLAKIGLSGGTLAVATPLGFAGVLTEAAAGTLSIASGTTFTLSAAGSTLAGAVTGAGTLAVGSGVSLDISGTASGGTLSLTGTGDKLLLDNPTAFGAAISGLDSTDGLDFTGFAPGTTTVGFVENAGNTAGVLTVKNGMTTVNITLNGNYSTGTFTPTTDGHSGTLVTYVPAGGAHAFQPTPAPQLAPAATVFVAKAAPSTASTTHASASPLAALGLSLGTMFAGGTRQTPHATTGTGGLFTRQPTHLDPAGSLGLHGHNHSPIGIVPSSTHY